MCGTLGAAGPSRRDIAGFSQFKETIKPFVPCNGEAAAREGDWRPGPWRALWLARLYTGSDILQTTENFQVYIPGEHAPLSKSLAHVLQE